MNFYILKDLNLCFKMSIMRYFQEIAQHLNPKLVGRIGFKHNGCDVIPQRVDNINEMPSCWSFLHNW